MASLVTEQGIVHYEAYGRGRPVLLLHGWMNSWALWRNTIEVLGKDFRLYALDFFGFGDSGAQAEEFSVNNFSLMVDSFMDRMGIVRAPLVGHSMGGTVSLSVAIRQPEKVVKVIVIGSPIQGNSLSPLLKLASYRGWIGLGQTTPILYDAFQKGFKPFLRAYSYMLAKDGRTLGNMLTTDVAKINATPFFESIGTLRATDLRPRVSELQMPVLGIYGRKDLIVDSGQGKVLKDSLPSSRVEMFDASGHFPMMDETERFHSTVREFLYNG
ncbi:MAG: alpha/beta hydrolase [Anaerolineae bacterium]|uniref:alpha/beta fold hydrolase n=1 Tax=Candidatus Flexifilum breve TaxID=3140694 RepID=UPI001AD1639A|nr:alpha/beta hydrolase [Chloroflexota bacterium]MBK9750269.1 alpha/beta hydrolase [Chloroflexota bacterium]MBN8639528.1 alpha/beta hydrolase [Anaerolineae bacterium]